MADSTSASLLLRLRDYNDDDAWSSFCDVYRPLLINFCQSRGMNANDAADVVQEVLLRVAKSIRQFQYDRTRGRFRDWLFRVVRNEIIRWQSRRKTPMSLIDADASDLTVEAQEWNQQFHQHILSVALERVRPRFSESTWQAFELVWIQQKTAVDVAKELDRPIDFVYVSKSRVLKRLRLEIEKLAEDACI